FGHRGDRAALEAVAAVDHERAFRILPPQPVDHRAQRREATAALEDRSATLVEKLVVDIELRVDVGCVQDRNVLGAAPLDRLVVSKFSRPCAATQAQRNRRRDAHRSDVLQETAPRAIGHRVTLVKVAWMSGWRTRCDYTKRAFQDYS